MQTAIVTLFPEVVAASLDAGVTGRAVRDGLIRCDILNPRDYGDDARKTVDDRPFGGGPGMVMKVAPLRRAVREAKERLPAAVPVILMTPQGERFDQRLAGELAQLPGFVLVAARYEGVDERFVESDVDRELSIGDYVLSGGELPALTVLDAAARQLPGVLGNPDSAANESHMDGLLDYPHYTRPEFDGVRRVSPVLLSGDHAAVAAWRRQAALARTLRRRPALLLDRELNAEDRRLLAACIEDAGAEDDLH